MKNSVILLSSVLFFGLASCKTKKSQTANSGSTSTTNTTPTKDSNTVTESGTTQQTVYNTVTDQNCAAEVAFGSPGSGIDGEALDKVTKLLDGKKIKYTTNTFGREGERRICMPLTELKASEKKELLDQLKKIAKEGQYVSLSIR
jgi:hypothetical protein